MDEKDSRGDSLPLSLTSVPGQRRKAIIVGAGCAASIAVMTAFALSPPTDTTLVEQRAVVEQLTTLTPERVSSGESRYLREERILHSDTVSSLAQRLGITNASTLAYLRTHKDAQAISRQMRPGKVVSAITTELGDLVSLYFPLNGKDSNLIIENKEGQFVVQEQALTLERRVVIKSGEIRHSLFGATDAAGIPDAIAIQLAEIFGADIDFHRDLRKGDRFSLVYEAFVHQGQPIRSGRILTAEFINNQKVYNAYWFETEAKKGGYYSSDGKNLRKAFLRSPLEFSRITSGYSTSRLHPVLQINRAHKGIDYGAPVGTKVRSVADGTIEFAGWQGGYGKMVVIKHQGAYSTAYGHLNGFANGIKKGARVSQGDTIGFTGQTGLASGPHLHYEFRINSKQVNPLATSLPAATPLDPGQIARFKHTITPLSEQLSLAKQITLATIE